MWVRKCREIGNKRYTKKSHFFETRYFLNIVCLIHFSNLLLTIVSANHTVFSPVINPVIRAYYISSRLLKYTKYRVKLVLNFYI